MRVSRYLVTAVFFAVLLGVQSPANGQTRDACADSRDLRLVNGKFVTMDAKSSVVNEVTIQQGRFAYLGKTEKKLAPCTKVINLGGRTVVPGLIDNHNHIVLFGMRPGHDIRLETANSIADVQARLASRAKSIPAGAWVTTLGDWNIQQFTEKRLPTLAELDSAVPANPVLISGGGGNATNTRGKSFFESKGIAVSAEGQIASGMPFIAALNALRAIQTFEEEKQGTEYAMNYVVSLGLTTNVDMGAFVLSNSPDVKDSALNDGVESLNPWTMYDALLALYRENKLTTRVRIFFLPQDTGPDVPILKERLLNTFPNYGDDMLRTSGIGEFATAWGYKWAQGERPANYETALQLIAKHGWAFQQHTLSLAEDKFTTDTFAKVNEITPIADLRWSIAHVPHIDQPTIDRLKEMGAGVAVHGWLYLSGKPGNGGPPFRMIVQSGIHASAGSDAAYVSVFDPWLEIYYMVTGKNSAGDLINDGQQITRMQALHLYTADNGWFLREEKDLGSIETGKFGDLAVLSADYTDPQKVTDEDIKKLRSVLTVVGGKVVYNDMH